MYCVDNGKPFLPIELRGKTTTMVCMAKTPKKRSEDRHASPFMVRLPESFHSLLKEHKRRTRVPMTAAIQLALEEYLAKHGLWPPGAAAE